MIFSYKINLHSLDSKIVCLHFGKRCGFRFPSMIWCKRAIWCRVFLVPECTTHLPNLVVMLPTKSIFHKTLNYPALHSRDIFWLRLLATRTDWISDWTIFILMFMNINFNSHQLGLLRIILHHHWHFICCTAERSIRQPV